ATSRGLPTRFAPEIVTSVADPRRTPRGPIEAIWGGSAKDEVVPRNPSTKARANGSRVMGGVPGRRARTVAGAGTSGRDEERISSEALAKVARLSRLAWPAEPVKGAGVRVVSQFGSGLGSGLPQDPRPEPPRRPKPIFRKWMRL